MIPPGGWAGGESDPPKRPTPDRLRGSPGIGRAGRATRAASPTRRAHPGAQTPTLDRLPWGSPWIGCPRLPWLPWVAARVALGCAVALPRG